MRRLNRCTQLWRRPLGNALSFCFTVTLCTSVLLSSHQLTWPLPRKWKSLHILPGMRRPPGATGPQPLHVRLSRPGTCRAESAQKKHGIPELPSFKAGGCPFNAHASCKMLISNKIIVFLFAFQSLLKNVWGLQKKEGRKKENLLFMEPLLYWGLSQTALSSFSRKHFANGAEATRQSKMGAQHQVREANK